MMLNIKKPQVFSFRFAKTSLQKKLKNYQQTMFSCIFISLRLNSKVYNDKIREPVIYVNTCYPIKSKYST